MLQRKGKRSTKIVCQNIMQASTKTAKIPNTPLKKELPFLNILSPIILYENEQKMTKFAKKCNFFQLFAFFFAKKSNFPE